MSATLGVLQARARDAAPYAIGGRAPGAAVRPASFAEVADVVRECAQRGLSLVPWGGGVTLANESAPPGRYDLALDLTALDQVAVYEPDDYTVTAGCGITMAALRARLAEHGQELPLETAREDAATLGGVLACNASGPRRLMFGAPRDRILGTRYVTGDGVLALAGGRVVKNVAGHAVHRLLVGSRGGLGLLLQASLKLMPQPPARVVMVHGLGAAALAEPARWTGFMRREPAALTVLGRELARTLPALAADAPFTVVTGFEGDPAWVEACRTFVNERLGAPGHELRGDAVRPVWGQLSDLHETPGPRLAFASANNTPAALAPLLDDPASARLLFHAPAGRLHLWPAPEGANAVARTMAAAGFTVIEARGVDVETPTPFEALQALRARLSAALDPAGILALGERWRTQP